MVALSLLFLINRGNAAVVALANYNFKDNVLRQPRNHCFKSPKIQPESFFFTVQSMCNSLMAISVAEASTGLSNDSILRLESGSKVAISSSHASMDHTE